MPMMERLKKLFQNKVVQWLAKILAPVLTATIIALVTPLGQWIVQRLTWGTINVTAKTEQDRTRFRESGFFVQIKNVNTSTEKLFDLDEPTRLEPGTYRLGLAYYRAGVLQLFSDSLRTFTCDDVSTNMATVVARETKTFQLSLSENGFLRLSVSGDYSKDDMRIKVSANDSAPVIDTSLVVVASTGQQLMPGRYAVRVFRKDALVYEDNSLFLRKHEVTPITIAFGVLKGKISGDENQIAVRIFNGFEIDVEGRREPVRTTGEYLIEDLIVRKFYHYRIFRDGTLYDSQIFFNSDMREILEQAITFSK